MKVTRFPFLDENTLEWCGHVFGPLRPGHRVPSEQLDYPAHRVCKQCGLSTVYLQAWPESCKSVPQIQEAQQEKEMKTKLELVPQGRVSVERVLPIFARKSPSGEVILYTNAAGVDIPLVGVESNSEGLLVATRWSARENSGVVARDEYNRIKDITKDR